MNLNSQHQPHLNTHLKPLFTGTLVRLAAPRPDDAEQFSRWTHNDIYLRLLDDDPARPQSAEAYAQWDQGLFSAPDTFAFRLRTLADDRLIGFIVLGGIKWPAQTAKLGIAIGDPDYWGRGYGTDAIRLILNYAFNELNLYRVGSGAMAYNFGSIRAHEKAGFQREGVERLAIARQGQRYDHILFGILRDEWLALNNR